MQEKEKPAETKEQETISWQDMKYERESEESDR